jgi:kumamolisin
LIGRGTFRALLPAVLTIAAAAPVASARSVAPAAPAASAAPATTPSGRALARATARHWFWVGPALPTQPIPIVMPLNVDGGGLARFAGAVSNPGSPLYGHYASVAALARRFGASWRERKRVVRFLRAHGARSVKVDATGMLAEATITPRIAERLFGTPLARFRRADHTRFLAPIAAVRLPAALRGLVQGVVGLDTEPLTSPARLSLDTSASRLPRLVPQQPTQGGTTPQQTSAIPRSGTPTGCAPGVAAGSQDNNPGFTPNQYLTAYDFDPLHSAGDAGQGERVALIEIDGFSQGDVNAFAVCFGLHVPPVNAYGVGVRRSQPATGEATLDLEVLDAAAPYLKAVDVYETKPDPAHTLAAFAAPLQNHGRVPQVISASFGLCEPDAFAASGKVGIEASEHVLEVAAAAGASVLAASGDNGSADCEALDNTPVDQLAVNYPASSRWVTAVGGTNLSLTSGNQIAGEQVWNDTTVADAASGGGVSQLFTRPSYQRAVVNVNRRELPDVSMLADFLPGYAIYCSATPQCVNPNNPSPWLTVGGTSAATPLLAGGVAIVDELLRQAQHDNLGLLNPLLYELGGSTAAGSVFTDVTAIGNDIGPYIPGGNGQPLGCCTAKVGYDDASGWGSVAVDALAQQALQLVPKTVSFSLAVPGNQRPVAHRQLLADVSCSAACDVGAYAAVTVGRAKPFTVNSKLYTSRTGQSTAIAIKLTPDEVRTLRSGLAHQRPIVATVYGVLVDELGAIQMKTPGKQLRIRS